MRKFTLTVVSALMVLAFMPYNLKEGPGIPKVTGIASDIYDEEYVRTEMGTIREGYRQMHKGTLLGSVGGLLVILLLLYIFI